MDFIRQTMFEIAPLIPWGFLIFAFAVFIVYAWNDYHGYW